MGFGFAYWALRLLGRTHKRLPCHKLTSIGTKLCQQNVIKRAGRSYGLRVSTAAGRSFAHHQCHECSAINDEFQASVSRVMPRGLSYGNANGFVSDNQPFEVIQFGREM